jgi:hypothetical protein
MHREEDTSIGPADASPGRSNGEIMSGGHGVGHDGHNNKKIALLISLLALFLALAETLAKGAQTNALSYNVEASNLWAFFQAKTIRQTAVRGLGEAIPLIVPPGMDEARQGQVAKQLDTWRKTVDRWETEPDTREGRRELAARAKTAEKARDLAMARYHQYEYSSAALQIGIVLASAAVITDVMLLAGAGGLLGLVGIGFIGLGLFAPEFLHLGH